MRRVSPLALTVPKRRLFTRVFHDPNQPEVEFAFTLGSRNFVVLAQANACQEELWEKWGPSDDHEQPAFPLKLEEGEAPVYVDRVLCQSAAMAWAMQAGPEGSRYSADELLAMAVTAPVAFEALVGWIAELSRPDSRGAEGAGLAGNGTGDLAGNASGAVTASW